MATDIFIANTDTEIESCFPAFSVLRPHLKQGDFLPQIRRQQKESYQILALKHEGVVKSVAGFRFGGGCFTLTIYQPFPERLREVLRVLCLTGWLTTQSLASVREFTWTLATHVTLHIVFTFAKVCS